MSDEHLIEAARTRRGRPPSRRDLLTSALLGGSFLAVAISIAVLVPWNRGVSPAAVAILVIGYALLSRVEFEVGTGSAVPVQLVLVPMLFALPVALVPLCVAAGYVVGALPDYVTGRVHPGRVLGVLTSSWYAVGPVVVLSLAPSARPTMDDAPIYIAALFVQFALDFASSAARQRIVFGHTPRSLLSAFGWVWRVDVLLTPIGLVGAASSGWAILLVGPLAGLLLLLARDRRIRIDQALTATEAYRGAVDQAHRDELTGIGNRRKLLHDLARLPASVEHALVIYDLNGFKHFNDTFGHPAGDVVLRRLARRLDASVGSGAAYRLGGDEFCVLAALPDRDVGRLLDATTGALSEDARGFSVSASFGSVFLPSEAQDATDALAIADKRLYAQKRARGIDRAASRLALVRSNAETAGAA